MFSKNFYWLKIILLLIILILVSGLTKEISPTHSIISSQSDSKITPVLLPLEEEISSQGQSLELLKSKIKSFVAILNEVKNPVENKQRLSSSESLTNTKKDESRTEINPEKQSIYTTIFTSYSVGPDCYREGSDDGQTGKNIGATCCNCGLKKSHGKCIVPEDDCGENGEKCCIQLGCLNKECAGKPTIWDSESGECGC